MSDSSIKRFTELRGEVGQAQKRHLDRVTVKVRDLDKLLSEYDEACSREAALLREVTQPLPLGS